MNQHKQILRIGAAAVVFAIALRLIGAGQFLTGGGLQNPNVLSFFVYLQTGRVVQLQSAPPEQEPTISVPPQEEAPSNEESTPEETPPQEDAPHEEESEDPPTAPVFSQTDLRAVSVAYLCDYRPDVSNLLTKPLSWSPVKAGPTVLIVHTHATESYEKQPNEDYVEDVTYRTLDDRYNMLSIGDEVARKLEAGGISVIHDKSYHDYPSYNDSYSNARVSIAEYLKKYPSIQMVLDIHRDASDGSGGTQLTTSATVNGQESAQLMVVVGTDASGNYHPRWQENLSVALKLTALLERQAVGLTRPIALRAQRFNMDLTAASLLIEVGAAGDTHAEAMVAAGELAKGILGLFQGSL